MTRIHIDIRQTKFAGNNGGFTVLELMIASVVFSVILLVISVGVIRFTSGYYHGINSSTTQTTAQNAIDAVSQAVQFSSSGTSVGSTGVFCAGGKLFTYSPGKKFLGTANAGDRGLYMMDNTSGGCAYPASLADGQELLGPNMRVVYASVTEPTVANKFLSTIKLKIAYGDDDLLCSAAKGNCNTDVVLTDSEATDPGVLCKTRIGSSFCSVVELSTVAQQRLVK